MKLHKHSCHEWVKYVFIPRLDLINISAIIDSAIEFCRVELADVATSIKWIPADVATSTKWIPAKCGRQLSVGAI